eukprot:GHVT01086830.1.p1 GENE.GHVT01086830.1~~GHVT01086830.1.p1  ORF type:complete len:1135 (-),score=272.28 GHVT01086830.1:3418-6822(-)
MAYSSSDRSPESAFPSSVRTMGIAVHPVGAFASSSSESAPSLSPALPGLHRAIGSPLDPSARVHNMPADSGVDPLFPAGGCESLSPPSRWLCAPEDGLPPEWHPPRSPLGVVPDCHEDLCDIATVNAGLSPNLAGRNTGYLGQEEGLQVVSELGPTSSSLPLSVSDILSRAPNAESHRVVRAATAPVAFPGRSIPRAPPRSVSLLGDSECGSAIEFHVPGDTYAAPHMRALMHPRTELPDTVDSALFAHGVEGPSRAAYALDDLPFQNVSREFMFGSDSDLGPTPPRGGGASPQYEGLPRGYSVSESHQRRASRAACKDETAADAYEPSAADLFGRTASAKSEVDRADDRGPFSATSAEPQIGLPPKRHGAASHGPSFKPPMVGIIPPSSAPSASLSPAGTARGVAQAGALPGLCERSAFAPSRPGPWLAADSGGSAPSAAEPSLAANADGEASEAGPTTSAASGKSPRLPLWALNRQQSFDPCTQVYSAAACGGNSPDGQKDSQADASPVKCEWADRPSVVITPHHGDSTTSSAASATSSLARLVSRVTLDDGCTAAAYSGFPRSCSGLSSLGGDGASADCHSDENLLQLPVDSPSYLEASPPLGVSSPRSVASSKRKFLSPLCQAKKPRSVSSSRTSSPSRFDGGARSSVDPRLKGLDVPDADACWIMIAAEETHRGSPSGDDDADDDQEDDQDELDDEASCSPPSYGSPDGHKRKDTVGTSPCPLPPPAVPLELYSESECAGNLILPRRSSRFKKKLEKQPPSVLTTASSFPPRSPSGSSAAKGAARHARGSVSRAHSSSLGSSPMCPSRGTPRLMAHPFRTRQGFRKTIPVPPQFAVHNGAKPLVTVDRRRRQWIVFFVDQTTSAPAYKIFLAKKLGKARAEEEVRAFVQRVVAGERIAKCRFPGTPAASQQDLGGDSDQPSKDTGCTYSGRDDQTNAAKAEHCDDHALISKNNLTRETARQPDMHNFPSQSGKRPVKQDPLANYPVDSQEDYGQSPEAEDDADENELGARQQLYNRAQLHVLPPPVSTGPSDNDAGGLMGPGMSYHDGHQRHLIRHQLPHRHASHHGEHEEAADEQESSSLAVDPFQLKLNSGIIHQGAYIEDPYYDTRSGFPITASACAADGRRRRDI